MLKLHNQTFGQQQTILNVRRLPARLNADQVAALIGCQPHDIPILVKLKLLVPLGKPPPNGVKFFATHLLEGLMTDPKWLDRITRAVNTHWHDQNLRRAAQIPEQPPA
jgi:hypothetical protein